MMRERPRLAKFLSHGEASSAQVSHFPSLYSSNSSLGYLGQLYVSSSHNNNLSLPPPKAPTSPVSKRKSRGKIKAKRAKSKPPPVEEPLSSSGVLDSYPSLDTSPPTKRRSPSKSRLARTQSRAGGERADRDVSPVNQRRSRSKTRVKRSQSIVSNIENLPPGGSNQSGQVDPPPTTSSPTNNKKGKNRNKTKIRRSQSEAPNRILSEKSLWEDLTFQAKENLQNYISRARNTNTVYGETVPVADPSLGSRCQCEQSLYPPVYPAVSRRGRSKSRKSAKPSGPYSLNSVSYVAPEGDLGSPCSPLPGVAVRGRSKSRSRQLHINNGLATIWPDSRGAWLPV